MDNYFATYTIATPSLKEEAGKLLGADNIIGDIYKVTTKIQGTRHVAKAVNRFSDSPVQFNEEISKKLSLNEAKDMITYAILTCVGFTQKGNDGNYWAEFILVSFLKKEIETFSVYVDELSKAIKNNKRPKVDLSSNEVEQIIINKGKYISSSKEPQIEKKNGQVILKSRVKLSDTLIEQGRKKNPGCYIFGWVFLLGFIALLIYILKTIFNF